MNSKIILIAAISAALLSAGCDNEAVQARGFSLPEGDVREGRQAFLDLYCHDCHTIADIERNPTSPEKGIQIALGGKVPGAKSYGELVTSIINPSHRITKGYPTEAVSSPGKSRMRYYNDLMTVEQLIDLVTFLQTEYQVEPYAATEYGLYYP